MTDLTDPGYKAMKIKSLLGRISNQEDLNFLLTNRIPRALLTRFMGRFSKIENPVVAKLSIAVWRPLPTWTCRKQNSTISRACTPVPAN